MKKIKIEAYPMVSPAPVVLIGATVNGKANYAAVGAFGVVCQAPLFYISLKNTHFTTEGIKETGFFSVNIPCTRMVRETDYCGRVSGRKTDKSDLFRSFYDGAGNAPMISDAPLNYLCKVVQSVCVRDFTAFFGEIIAAYADEECFPGGKIDPAKADPIFLMGTGYYALGRPIGKIFQEGDPARFLSL